MDVKIAEEHTLDMVWEGDCYHGSEVSCRCGWRGNPSDYTTHFMLVVTDTQSQQVRDWLNLFPTADIEAYLDLYRPPSEVAARKAVIAKQRKEERAREKLIRMAANGDAKAKEELNVAS
jgi:hypothetical protein